MNLAKLQLGITLALVAAVVAEIAVQQRTNTRLRSEVAALRQEMRTADRNPQVSAAEVQPRALPEAVLVAADGSSDKIAPTEWQQLRRDIDTLKARTQAIVQTQAAQSPDSSGPPPGGFVAVGALKNLGRAVPTSALETMLWAAVQGDLDTLAGSLWLDKGARAKADAWFATLPPESQAQFGSPEKVLATLISSRVGKDLAAIGVVAQADQGPDLTLLRVRFQSAEGLQKDDRWPFRRTEDGWRMIINEKGLDSIGKLLGDKPPAGQKPPGG